MSGYDKLGALGKAERVEVRLTTNGIRSNIIWTGESLLQNNYAVVCEYMTFILYLVARKTGQSHSVIKGPISPTMVSCVISTFKKTI